MSEKMKLFEAVDFNLDEKIMYIKIGTTGSYDYRDIEKCAVLNESARYRGTSKPFEHQILDASAFVTILGDPDLYVGLKLTMKDGRVLAIYVSDDKTTFNTDIYLRDHQEAERVKNFIDKIIQKYHA